MLLLTKTCIFFILVTVFSVRLIIDSSLVPALKAWTNLTELHLKICSNSDRDMEDLVDGIKTSSNLSTLDLRDNDIGDEGCQALSLALCHDYVTKNSSIPHLEN